MTKYTTPTSGAADRAIENCPELNMGNYDEVDVERLNDWAIRAHDEIDRLHALAAGQATAAQAAESVTEPAGVEEGDIDAVALARYKVVHSHDSMFHRFAVVAGDGKQQLYLGRETECQNMTRKFAGAFLDGAFYQSQIAAAPTPAAQAADSVLEDAARYRWLRERSSTMFVNISINGEGAEIAATLDSAVDTARAAQKEVRDGW